MWIRFLSCTTVSLIGSQSTLLNPASKIAEKVVQDQNLGESYVALTVTHGASLLDTTSFEETPFLRDNGVAQGKQLPKLDFVPYYFRANRGGKGHMRVGLKTAA